jgi:hypothetical protein
MAIGAVSVLTQCKIVITFIHGYLCSFIRELFQSNRILQSLLDSYINGIHWLPFIPFLDQATGCAGSLALLI